jgi:hypothetical protein
MRAEGFKGAGSEYSLPDPDHYVLLGFQRVLSIPTEVKFTINLKVVLRSAWAEARSQSAYLPPSPRVNIGYAGAPEWWMRIGRLMSEPQPHEHWWWLRSTDDPVPLADEVMGAIRTLAIPALRERINLTAH